MRGKLASLLIIAIIFTMIPNSIWAETKTDILDKTTWDMYAAETFAGGDGTLENPYQISNAAELALWATELDKNKYDFVDSINPMAHANFVLTSDIDLSEHYWNLAGICRKDGYWKNYTDPFVGVFDGNGHSIDNMIIASSTIKGASKVGRDDLGLFAVMYGTVKNLNINNFYIDVDINANQVGAVAAEMCGIIENCSVSGNIVCNKTSVQRTGGIAGLAINSEIKKCISNVNMILEDHGSASGGSVYVGGIVGSIKCNKFVLSEKEIEEGMKYLEENRACEISDCVTLGSIYGGYFAVAGIAGYVSCAGTQGEVNLPPYDFYIKNCISAMVLDCGTIGNNVNHGNGACGGYGGIVGDPQGNIFLWDNLFMGSVRADFGCGGIFGQKNAYFNGIIPTDVTFHNQLVIGQVVKAVKESSSVNPIGGIYYNVPDFTEPCFTEVKYVKGVCKDSTEVQAGIEEIEAAEIEDVIKAWGWKKVGDALFPTSNMPDVVNSLLNEKYEKAIEECKSNEEETPGGDITTPTMPAPPSSTIPAPPSSTIPAPTVPATDAPNPDVEVALSLEGKPIITVKKPIATKQKLDIQKYVTEYIPAASNKKIKYLSSDKTTAVVNSKGLVKAKQKTGRSAVRISVVDKKTKEEYGYVILNVAAPEVIVKKELHVGESMTVDSYFIGEGLIPTQFLSKKPAIASVYSDGTIKACKKGQTVITYQVGEGKYAAKYKIKIKVAE